MHEHQTIDPELWLNFLLARMADEQAKQALINELALECNISTGKVEEMMHMLTEMLLDITRSN